MRTSDLIEEVASLPVQERARLLEFLLESLNALNEAVDAAWVEVVLRRLNELRSGAVAPVPGEAAFEPIRQRYAK